MDSFGIYSFIARGSLGNSFSVAIKSTRIYRAGSYIKPLLVQVANAVIRSKEHPEFGERYRRIKARRRHKKAIIVVCRMLLTAIWNILSKLEPYSPDGFLSPRPVDKAKVLTKSQELELLRLNGYVLTDDPPLLTTA